MTPLGTTNADLIVIAGMLAGFFAISKVMLNQTAKEREADRNERQELSLAIKEMAKSSEKVASATERSAKEAKERNGHIVELVLESRKETLAAIKTIDLQHVGTQQVDKQVIKK